MKKAVKILENTLLEWQDVLESQGEDWEQYERQEGEIDGLKFAIDTIKESLK